MLQTLPGEDALALFRMLLNNVCYVLEFRETVLHTLTSYNENRNSKYNNILTIFASIDCVKIINVIISFFFDRLYMRDVVETTHIFFKLMEKFCNGSVIVQDKNKRKHKKTKSKKPKSKSNHKEDADDTNLVSTCWCYYSDELIYLF